MQGWKRRRRRCVSVGNKSTRQYDNENVNINTNTHVRSHTPTYAYRNDDIFCAVVCEFAVAFKIIRFTTANTCDNFFPLHTQVNKHTLTFRFFLFIFYSNLMPYTHHIISIIITRDILIRYRILIRLNSSIIPSIDIMSAFYFSSKIRSKQRNYEIFQRYFIWCILFYDLQQLF